MINTSKTQSQHAISLSALATEINDKHRQIIGFARTTLESARDAGRLLIAAKSEVSHGNWAQWIDDNLEVKSRSVRKYMQVAENWDLIKSKTQANSILTMGSALRLIAKPSSIQRQQHTQQGNEKDRLNAQPAADNNENWQHQRELSEHGLLAMQAIDEMFEQQAQRIQYLESEVKRLKGYETAVRELNRSVEVLAEDVPF